MSGRMVCFYTLLQSKPKHDTEGAWFAPRFPRLSGLSGPDKIKAGPRSSAGLFAHYNKIPRAEQKENRIGLGLHSRMCLYCRICKKKDEPSVKRGDVASKQQGGMRPGWLPRSQCFQHDGLPSPGGTRCVTPSLAAPSHPPRLSSPPHNPGSLTARFQWLSEGPGIDVPGLPLNG